MLCFASLTAICLLLRKITNFDLLVSFCRLDLGLCAKNVFNKIRCTAASAEHIFAGQRARPAERSRHAARQISPKSKPNAMEIKTYFIL